MGMLDNDKYRVGGINAKVSVPWDLDRLRELGKPLVTAKKTDGKVWLLNEVMDRAMQ